MREGSLDVFLEKDGIAPRGGKNCEGVWESFVFESTVIGWMPSLTDFRFGHERSNIPHPV